MTGILSLAFLAAIIRGTVPLALAATGGLYSERGGVINIALEGLMIVGAFAGVCGAYYGGGALPGIVAGAAAGALLGLAYAFIVVRLGSDQIVTGVAFNLLALALSRYLLQLIFGSAANSEKLEHTHRLFRTATLAHLATNPLVLLTLAIVVGTHFVLQRTRFGLRLRASGDHPEAAASLGVDVARLRMGAVAVSGALAGLGGVWLVMALDSYTSDLISGGGYMALAALIFGGWRPLPVLAAAALFGFANALAVQLRTDPAVLRVVPAGYIMLLPYLLTIAALVVRRRRGYPGDRSKSRAPAALGQPLGPG